MNLPIVLDLETVPQESALAAPYPREDRSPPSNWKDEAKIAQWYVDDEAKWKSERVKECSLNPRLGRIVMCGLSLPCSDGPALAPLIAQTEADEPDLLNSFWNVASVQRGRVVTFNGRTFDLRWLVLRSLAHGITPSIPADTIRSWFAKYRVSPHCDVRDLLTNWDSRESGTLAEWCALVGVKYDEKVGAGSDIYDMYRNGNFSGIAAKNRADVESLRQLYEKISRTFVSEAA